MNNKIYLKFITVTLIVSLMIMLGNCSSKKTNEEEEIKTPEELYSEASSYLSERNYKKAAETFSQISYKYPYYKGATKAEMMEIYSYYLNKDYDNTILSSEHFIKMYPASQNIDYIYYMIAKSYYEQMDIPQRDQNYSAKAKQAFIELITRFPNSDYSKDAKIKIELIDDHLAAEQMEIGKFYLKKGNTLAAVNRFKTVVEHYSTTSHIEEALYRLTEAYLFLGLHEDAKKYASTLGHNYPQSKWYKDSYDLLTK